MEPCQHALGSHAKEATWQLLPHPLTRVRVGAAHVEFKEQDTKREDVRRGGDAGAGDEQLGGEVGHGAGAADVDHRICRPQHLDQAKVRQLRWLSNRMAGWVRGSCWAAEYDPRQV